MWLDSIHSNVQSEEAKAKYVQETLPYHLNLFGKFLGDREWVTAEKVRTQSSFDLTKCRFLHVPPYPFSYHLSCQNVNEVSLCSWILSTSSCTTCSTGTCIWTQTAWTTTQILRPSWSALRSLLESRRGWRRISSSRGQSSTRLQNGVIRTRTSTCVIRRWAVTWLVNVHRKFINCVGSQISFASRSKRLCTFSSWSIITLLHVVTHHASYAALLSPLQCNWSDQALK